MIKGILIPDWLSFNVYRTKNDIRVYISNELSHEFYLLSGITAELFLLISNIKSIKEIDDFAERNNIQDELMTFLEELSSSGIISLNSSDNPIKFNAVSLTPFSDDETLKFQSDMKDYISNNGFMYSLFIELTYKCNLKCIHCFNDKHFEKELINFENIKETIDYAHELGVFNITLSGGECTLSKDFLKIAKYIREKRISLDIFTNGQVLYDNEKLFNELLGIYPHCISLSLYSMNPEIHDKITGIKNSHFKTLSVINKLRNNNVKTVIKCFLLNINADDYKDIQEYAKKIGAVFSPDGNFVNNPSRNNENVQCSEEQLFNIYSDKDSSLKTRKVFSCFNDAFYQKRICTAGYNGLTIAPDLSIYPCVTLKKLLGNVCNTSIKDIWLNKVNCGIENIRKLKQYDLKECFKEEYCLYCSYCPGMAMLNDKYLKKYDSFCKHAKMRMKAFEHICGNE